MARGMANNEPIVSQAATEDYRRNYPFGDRKAQRGSWVMDPKTGKLVPSSEYRRTDGEAAIHAPIIADRLHEGTFFDDGDRKRDLGSRRKRREFLRETGLAEKSDASPSWLESRAKAREREADRRVDASAEQAARKLYHLGKMRD
jgi:hypothetical protein